MKISKRILSLLLGAVFALSCVPVFAEGVSVPKNYDKVYERQMQLAPGITQDTVVAYDSEGHRQEYYAATADLSVNTVKIETNYKNHQCSERGLRG